MTDLIYSVTCTHTNKRLTLHLALYNTKNDLLYTVHCTQTDDRINLHYALHTSQ